MFGFSPRSRAIVSALTLALVLTTASAFGAGQVGETAAGFNLESLDGGFIALGDHAGEVVVLHIIGYG